MQTGLAAFFQRLWTSNEVLAVLIAAVLSVAGWIIGRYIVGRGTIGWGVSNQHLYTIPSNPQMVVHTRQIWVQNIGRSIAESIEVLLMSQPGHYEVWPKRNFTPVINPDGSFMLKFDNLNSREFFTISMFQVNNPIPFVNNVRWRGGVGKEVPMAPQQQFAPWKYHVVRLLFWFGLFSLVYVVVRFFMR